MASSSTRLSEYCFTIMAVAPSGLSSSASACKKLGFSQNSPLVSSETYSLLTPSLKLLRLASKSFLAKPSSFVLISSSSRTMISHNSDSLMSPSFNLCAV